MSVRIRPAVIGKEGVPRTLPLWDSDAQGGWGASLSGLRLSVSENCAL